MIKGALTSESTLYDGQHDEQGRNTRISRTQFVKYTIQKKRHKQTSLPEELDENAETYAQAKELSIVRGNLDHVA